MLLQLHISNYALIEKADLSFEKGFTAITGETGSGKSILLGAFGLLLGDRADLKAIQDDKSKCVVEAVFDLKGYGLKSFFAEHDLDYDQQTTIRREISPGGKSRAFINDTPVQLVTLRQLGSLLVDIHSQHENSLLGERSFQFGMADAFAGHDELLKSYQQLFAQYKTSAKELDDLRSNEAKLRQELDYLKFQWTELDKADLESIDQKTMEEELETLQNAEQIKSTLVNATQQFDAETAGVLSSINQIKSSLAKVSSFHTQLDEFSKRVESTYIELRELVREMEHFESGLSLDEKRIDFLNEKLSALYALQQKHRIESVAELIALRNEIEAKTGGNESLDEVIAALEKKVSEERAQLENIASQISKARVKAASQSESEVKKYFEALQLEHAELKFEIKPAAELNQYGQDDIQLLFKANKGGQLLPVKQVASGGEISRVMLAIKASVSRHRQLPVLILDEIDQGVSGEVGKKIGAVLKEMSSKMQLLTITHLPQIAGKANAHLKVYKETDDRTTRTHIEILQGEDRVNELAEMLSGKELTKAALENAKEMLTGK